MKRSIQSARGARSRGFTLLELLAVITIAGLVLAVAAPSSVRLYESIQYRQAIRDLVITLSAARHAALASGRARDVAVDPRHNQVQFDGKTTRLPAEFQLAVRSARELNRDALGVIRFYPEGGSSGGGIDITRPGGAGVAISVDWLVGRVTQAPYEVE